MKAECFVSADNHGGVHFSQDSLLAYLKTQHITNIESRIFQSSSSSSSNTSNTSNIPTKFREQPVIEKPSFETNQPSIIKAQVNTTNPISTHNTSVIPLTQDVADKSTATIYNSDQSAMLLSRPSESKLPNLQSHLNKPFENCIISPTFKPPQRTS
jgi:hypothetical protein